MPTGNKIALFGFGIGRIGKLLYAGTAALTLAGTQNKKSDIEFDMLKIAKPADYTALVKAYKKVQRRYYPEKDVLNTGSEKCHQLIK